jgi:hypothetical protein
MLIELNLTQYFLRVVGVHHRQIDWFSQLLAATGKTGGKLPAVEIARGCGPHTKCGRLLNMAGGATVPTPLAVR